MKLQIKIFFLVGSLLLFATGIKAQKAIAISSNPGPGLHVALNWSPVKSAVKYNIFRRNETDTKYPAIPLNATPIQALTNCISIKSLLITTPDSAAWKMLAKGLSVKNKLFDPCKLATIGTATENYKRLQALAKGSMPIAMAAGWGYRDKTVTAGKVYYYKIVALNTAGTIVETIATDIKVTAGAFTSLPAPASISAEAGDDLIQAIWSPVDWAAGYILERSSTFAGLYVRVNESRYTLDIKKKLNGDTVVPNARGMIDYQRYDTLTGKDSIHMVFGSSIDGPKNGITYYYKVKAIDLFDRPGTASAITGPHTPVDSTAPSVPLDITTVADNIAGSVTIRWTQVVKNISGHWERPDSSVRYKLYRFTSSENPDSIPSVMLGANIITKKGLHARDTVDADPNLRAIYGNRTWWYRLRSVDMAGNISQWSTASSAIIKDITPPSITKNVSTKGYEDYIAVKWKPNTEPDMASYVIYRSYCHLGSWVECKEQDTCKTWQSYNPYNEKKEEPIGAVTYVPEKKPGLPCPCSGPFVFLGEITKDSVKRAIEKGHYFFEDKNIPAGSPLCYAYWIKAKDSSDNISGAFPLPSPAEIAEIKCERLHDLTPPEKALISGLFAQAEQIKVEWIGPPTQDTRAYHVYRAMGTNPAKEPLPVEYKWVGGMTVELPPVLPKVLSMPYKAPALATCDKISVQATPWMSAGYFEDKSIEPKLTYWYKVVGIDYDGNETPLDSAAAISTFSFTRKMPLAPVINSLNKQAEPCAVTISWSPVFDAGKHRGFIVYRSNSSGGPFWPVVVSPLMGNSFTDYNVIKGQTYWYKLGLLMLNGQLSRLSLVQSITP